MIQYLSFKKWILLTFFFFQKCFFYSFSNDESFLNLNASKDTKAAEGLDVEVAEGLHLDLDLDLAAGADGRRVWPAGVGREVPAVVEVVVVVFVEIILVLLHDLEEAGVDQFGGLQFVEPNFQPDLAFLGIWKNKTFLQWLLEALISKLACYLILWPLGLLHL